VLQYLIVLSQHLKQHQELLLTEVLVQWVEEEAQHLADHKEVTVVEVVEVLAEEDKYRNAVRNGCIFFVTCLIFIKKRKYEKTSNKIN
jgi:hypothetical protein